MVMVMVIFKKEITKVVSGQWSVRARTWALRSVGQRLWSVYPRFCYCGQGQWSEVRETDHTTLKFLTELWTFENRRFV